MSLLGPSFLRSVAVGALVGSVTFGVLSRQADAAAAMAQPQEEASARAAAALKRLPAGPGELVFRGENASRRWSVFLSPAEAARTQSFQLAMLNAVVVLPERSSLKLIVNGRVLSTQPVRSAGTLNTVLVRIPPGVLTPGANDVQMRVALAHRVDCSVKATYELWALLDPAKTGFVLDGPSAAYAIHSLDDLAAEPAGEDGATHIHVRLPVDADPVAIGRAGRLVNAVVRRAGLLRPVVDVGPEEGQGAGLDLVPAAAAAGDILVKDLRVLDRENGVTVARDPATNRLVVVLSGADDAETDEQIANLEAAVPKARPPSGGVDDFAIKSGGRVTFAELGLATDNFEGRRYLSSASVTLPTDFFSAGNDRARLLLDGVRSGGLDPDSQLVFRVNGAIASSMRLASGVVQEFNHKIVELPLRFFHPGPNEIAIEGVLPSPADRQCDVASSSRESRLSIAGTSELQFPQFAHLRTLPQLASTLTDDVRDRDGQVNLYLPDASPGAIGAALSVLANMAPQIGSIKALVVHLEPPERDDVPGVVIAPFDQLPEFLAASLRGTMSPSDASRNDAVNVAGAAPPPASPDAFKRNLDWNSALETVRAQLGIHGFFYGGDRGADALSLSPNGLLVGAVDPTIATPILGGLAIPQIVVNPRQWLVVTARSAESYPSAVDRMIANGKWGALAGEAVSFDPDTDQLRSVQPMQVSYVLPDRFVVADVRPILGGLFSDNILLSLGVLMLLMSLLGLSTHALIRRMGAR
jgi:hypothetical protein